MNTKKNYDEINFQVLRKISNESGLSQRKMANQLGFSLGKINYCLRELQKKGLVKVKKFKKNPNKIGYLYILTPKGITTKARVTINFMKQKADEYKQLKSEALIQKTKTLNEDLL